MTKYILPILLGVANVPLGCTMAPKYTRPNAPIPAGWPNGAAYAATESGTNSAAASSLEWQAFFTDDKLRQVIGAALTNNLDLRVAALNVELTRSLYDVRRVDLLPTVNAIGRGSKQRDPADLMTSGGQRKTIESYSVNLGVFSWEPDFFGRLRSLKERALQEYLATEQARRSAQILLVSTIAGAYLTLAADQESLQLAETTLTSQQDAYHLIKRRSDIGLVTELDLYRAQAQVDAARGDVAAFTQRTAQDVNALNLLAGCPVPDSLLPRQLSAIASPADISAGLSSEVLLRRPDVAQSEELLKAANADIAAARAAFFPRISLTAAFGTASSELSGLFKPGSGTWNYAPQIVVPVFDARTWSAFRAAKTQQKIAVAQYEKSIQGAFREVADALAVCGTVNQHVAAQQSLVDAVAATHRLSTSRYDKGLDSYLSVLDAQRSLYGAQQGLVQLRLAKHVSQVRLYAALGGGEASEPQPGK